MHARWEGIKVIKGICGMCRIIGAAFNNDKSFHNVLNTAFEHFLNLSPRAPEYISLFMDDQLRKVRAHLLPMQARIALHLVLL